ncbi:MAG: hypothetical protein WCI75_17235 [candidate division NC10 bacterium]
MSTSPFELRVIHPTFRQGGKPREGEYGLALYQQAVRTRGRAVQPEEPRLVVRIWGTPFRATVDRTLATLRQAGYRASDLSKTRTAPFLLDEEAGVWLGLLFIAAKPLRKSSRIDAISGAIWAMGPEESYYWFSRCTDMSTGRRARRALRLLLASD